jgi:hypothetical protein
MGAIPASFLPPWELWPDRIYEWPREVACLPQLPRAPGSAGPGTGKLPRRVLREQADRV